MINSKINKGAPKEDAQEKLFRLLESIDWKLWEMYNMMKDLSQTTQAPAKTKKKTTNE